MTWAGKMPVRTEAVEGQDASPYRCPPVPRGALSSYLSTHHALISNAYLGIIFGCRRKNKKSPFSLASALNLQQAWFLVKISVGDLGLGFLANTAD